ncbi:MAG: IS1595 family transposase [Gemmatimonadetes bacterium]|nr:IS1595 family transposase [Gemmatimonadota bacterium]MCY3678634.1 IS1595 family transposase [Gemmatimonadota bacterium]
MAKKSQGKRPGKYHRKGMSLVEVVERFSTDDAAREWFEDARWGGEPACPHCGSVNVQTGAKHPSQTHRCREKGCRKFFSVTTGTAMQSTKLGLRTWAIAIYLMSTELKGRSSMKFHRDLGIGQKAAWHLAHRLREAWVDTRIGLFDGPVEIDESYFGGAKKNQPKHKQTAAKGGTAHKTAVLAIKDRKTKKVSARVIRYVNAATLQGFVKEHAKPGATVYTDGASQYRGLAGYIHSSVAHSEGEYVKGDVHTNSVESFWSMLKRGYHGVYHRISPKHLGRYAAEFAGRQNMRELDTIDQMRLLVRGLEGKRLRFTDLTADTGISSKAT